MIVINDHNFYWFLIGYVVAVFEANVVTYGILVALLTAPLVWKMHLIVSLRRSIRKRRLSKAAIVGAKEVSEPVDSWRLANNRARAGMARLKVVESDIDRDKLTRTTCELRDEADLDHQKAA